MTADRDALAGLIRKAGWDAQDSPDYEKCGFDSDLFIADAILAAGWRAPEPTSCTSYIVYRGVRLDCDRAPGPGHEHHGKPPRPSPHIYWGEEDDASELA